MNRVLVIMILVLTISQPALAGDVAQKIVGGSLMGVGVIMSIAGLVLLTGPPTGGNPCGDELREEGQTEDECWDEVDDDREKTARVGRLVIPAGAITFGVGSYMMFSTRHKVSLSMAQDRLGLSYSLDF